MLRIGVSACFLHADWMRPIFKGRTLLYLVEDMSNWLLNYGVMPYMIPAIPKGSRVALSEMVEDLDGLVLQGGADVSPETYGETPLRPEWAGDAVRDRYEIELVEAFAARKKPVLGICRGLQLINVAYGGTLYQDIATQVTSALQHRNWEIYEANCHEVEFGPGAWLSGLHGGAQSAKVNSVHHQAIKDLGKGLKVEAHSASDRIIEAARLEGDHYVAGVQWHPEFQNPTDGSLIETRPLLDDFVEAVRRRKQS